MKNCDRLSKAKGIQQLNEMWQPGWNSETEKGLEKESVVSGLVYRKVPLLD